MSQPAVISGDYTDLRFVKGRKVAQIVVEIPIEAAGAFVEAFGTPQPDKNVPIALARLNAPVAHEKAKGGKLAQQAGILCNEVAFWTFCNEKLDHYTRAKDEPTAAQILRDWCLVGTRRELDHNPEAARRFLDLRASYNAWASQ